MASCSHWVDHVRAAAGLSPAPRRVARAEEREQPVPCVFFVSTRLAATRCTDPSALTTALSAMSPSRCPPLTTTAVLAAFAHSFAVAIASSRSLASSVWVRTANSFKFGVMRSTWEQRSRTACSASFSSRRSPLVATITGSSTTGTSAGRRRRKSATLAVMAASASMPIFTASISTSSMTESSCSCRKSTGGTWTLRTPWVF